MSEVLIVGCGDLGKTIAERLLKLGLQVTGVRRRLSESSEFPMIAADVTLPETLGELFAVSPQVLIYCVSADMQSDQSYFEQYVLGLQNVIEILHTPTSSLRHIIFVSSTRVYGQASDDYLDERVAAQPNDFGGRRLLQAEEIAAKAGIGYTIMRLSGIYGPGRHRMISLASHSASWPPQNTWTNRIHRDDAADFIAFTVSKILSQEIVDSCYIVTDSRPASQHEVLHWLANKLGGQGSDLTMHNVSGGKRLSNARLLATGFKLQYPDYQIGYQRLLDDLG